MSNGPRPLGEFSASLVQVVFSLTFPLLLITVCGVSFVLTAMGAPEFSFWSGLAGVVLDYASSNIWVALILIVFCLAAVPLAWIAIREQQLKISSLILAWVLAGIAFAGMVWLRTAWPFDQTGWQLFVYGIFLFGGWASVIEATLGTLGFVAHVRGNRPRRVPRPAQEPHGSRGQGKPGSDPETI